jgi:hypothetical protein
MEIDTVRSTRAILVAMLLPVFVLAACVVPASVSPTAPVPAAANATAVTVTAVTPRPAVTKVVAKAASPTVSHPQPAASPASAGADTTSLVVTLSADQAEMPWLESTTITATVRRKRV